MATVKEHILWFKPPVRPGGQPRVICSCGQGCSKEREKVRLRWIEKHIEKHGAKWATSLAGFDGSEGT